MCNKTYVRECGNKSVTCSITCKWQHSWLKAKHLMNVVVAPKSGDGQLVSEMGRERGMHFGRNRTAAPVRQRRPLRNKQTVSRDNLPEYTRCVRKQKRRAT